MATVATTGLWFLAAGHLTLIATTWIWFLAGGWPGFITWFIGMTRTRIIDTKTTSQECDGQKEAHN